MKQKTLSQLAPEAARILDSLSQDGEVRQMRRYRQHGDVSTFDHCRNVGELSVRINRRLHLRADEAALARGAMLHDFYLYELAYARPVPPSARLPPPGTGGSKRNPAL